MTNHPTLGLIAYFVRRHRRRSLLLVLLLCLSGLAEGIGIVSLLPVLDMAVAGDSTQQPSGLTLAVHAALSLVGLEPHLWVLLSLIVLGMVLKAILYLAAMKQVGYTVARVTTELRLELIRALLKSRWSYFVSQPAGQFANAISGEASRAASAYRAATALLAGCIQVIVYTIIAILLSWQIALFAVFGGVLVVALLGRLIALARSAGFSQTELMKSLISRLTDALQGIKPIKAMGQEVSVQPLLEAETRGLNEAAEKQVLATEALKAAQEPILVILLAVALFVLLSFGRPDVLHGSGDGVHFLSSGRSDQPAPGRIPGDHRQ
jgi:ATP-binding cassette, subfamily C, bacterial